MTLYSSIINYLTLRVPDDETEISMFLF